MEVQELGQWQRGWREVGWYEKCESIGRDYQFSAEGEGEEAKNDTQDADLENRVADCVTCNSKGGIDAGF